MKPRCPNRAFTLIEVIVALGILGGGLVAVLAMFAPLARVEAGGTDMLAATGAAAAVNAQLRQLSLAEAASTLGSSFLVNRPGDRVGSAADPVWSGHEEERFFTVAVEPNPTLGAGGPVAALPWVAFNLRVRWPVFAAESGQHELVIAGSVHR